MAALAVLLPALACTVVALRIGYRRGWDARGLEDQPGAQDDGEPWLTPEPVAIAAITAPREMWREATRAPKHAYTEPREDVRFSGDYPHPGRFYRARPYARHLDRERLPGEDDIAWMERIMAEHRVLHGLEA
jgi:hypothetical protein